MNVYKTVTNTDLYGETMKRNLMHLSRITVDIVRDAQRRNELKPKFVLEPSTGILIVGPVIFDRLYIYICVCVCRGHLL